MGGTLSFSTSVLGYLKTAIQRVIVMVSDQIAVGRAHTEDDILYGCAINVVGEVLHYVRDAA
jgi:hypothetical protein